MTTELQANSPDIQTSVPVRFKNPFLWVPTSYFAMGTVYITVSTASNIMFSNLGLPNDKAAAYSSLTGLAFTFKPFWAPLLELYKTKKFFVVVMQFILAVVFAGLALLLPFSGASSSPIPASIGSVTLPLVAPIFLLLMLAAVTGATQDIVSDGVYVTTLDSKNQAKYTGIQSMCWNIGFVVAGGLLVLLVGRLAGETQTGPKPVPSAYSSAWAYVFGASSLLMLALATWHIKMLPEGSKAQNAPRSLGEGLSSVSRAFVTFFQKKDIFLLLGFALFSSFWSRAARQDRASLPDRQSDQRRAWSKQYHSRMDEWHHRYRSAHRRLGSGRFVRIQAWT